MKLNIEELAKQSGAYECFGCPSDWTDGDFIVSPEDLSRFARTIVDRCAVTARDAIDSGWDGATVATIIRNLLED